MPPFTESENLILAHRRKLPVDWKPPPINNWGLGFRNGYDAMLQHLPVAQLPGGLEVLSGQRLQPPKFHYGWPTDPDRFAELAKRKGFISFRVYVSEPVGASDKARMHYMYTLQQLQKKLREELDITSLHAGMGRAYSELEPDCLFLSVWDTYSNGTANPPAADVEKLRQWLGFEEPAMWYLDMRDMQRWDVRYVRNAPKHDLKPIIPQA